MSEEVNEVTASYYRCRQHKEFIDTFYELFLAKSPEIAKMFAKTDFRIQKLMLRQSLLALICFDRGIAGTREEIDRLAGRHKELNVKPEMYSMWLDALCETVQQYDPQYTPELEQQWRQAMRKSIDEMIAAGARETGD